MLPYTAQMTGYIDHVIPAALLVWAILCYRRPLTSGMLLGLATGLVYYPLFLLPLWVSFYWRRGLMRFAIGVVVTLTGHGRRAWRSFRTLRTGRTCKQMFGLWPPQMEGLQGIWGLGWDPVYRIPVLAAFFALSLDAGDLAAAEEPRHPAQLLGGRDGRHAILARLRGRAVHGLVSAPDVADRLPSEPGRPRRAGRVGRRLEPLADGERDQRV